MECESCMGVKTDSEKLKAVYDFLDGMTKKEDTMPKVAMPKWMLQGFFYGVFLGLIGYLAGAIAINAVPAAFPATLPVISAALGFLGSIGIAYTRDITE